MTGKITLATLVGITSTGDSVEWDVDLIYYDGKKIGQVSHAENSPINFYRILTGEQVAAITSEVQRLRSEQGKASVYGATMPIDPIRMQHAMEALNDE